MKRTDTIAGIDIGSSAIRVVVGQQLENGQIQIIGVGEAPSRGISKATITDLDEAVTSLSEALENAERMIGAPLSGAVLGVNGAHCKVIESQGVVAVSKPNGEVQQSDVDRADEQSQAMATSPNYEILHVLPKYYNVDNQTHVKDPLGMTGIKLEAHTQVILALSSQVKLLNKCLYRTQLDSDGLVFAPLAASQAVLNKRQKDLGVAMVNLGAWTTSVTVYEEGELLHAAVLPIGSDHVTGDLAIGLRVGVDVAERVKVDQVIMDPEKISKRDEIDVAKYSHEEMPRMLFPRKHIAEIMEARLDEIFGLVQTELKKCGRAGKLPAGVVLTGGGAKLGGIVDYAKERLQLPVFVASMDHIFTPIDKVKDSQFSTALGLVYFATPGERSKGMPDGVRWFQDAFGGIFRKFKDFTS